MVVVERWRHLVDCTCARSFFSSQEICVRKRVLPNVPEKMNAILVVPTHQQSIPLILKKRSLSSSVYIIPRLPIGIIEKTLPGDPQLIHPEQNKTVSWK